MGTTPLLHRVLAIIKMITPHTTYLPTGIDYLRKKITTRQERRKNHSDGKEPNLSTKNTQRQMKMNKTLLLIAVGLCLLVGTQASSGLLGRNKDGKVTHAVQEKPLNRN